MARPKVILFDVNETLLDLQPMKDHIGELLGAGPGAARLWFTTLLQYPLVGMVAGKYLDFAEVGAAYLRMVAENHGVELSEEEAKEAVAPMRSLPLQHGRQRQPHELRNLGHGDSAVVPPTAGSASRIELA
jgi:2-haloacid dehalogenase